jgi:hypothetical protein
VKVQVRKKLTFNIGAFKGTVGINLVGKNKNPTITLTTNLNKFFKQGLKNADQQTIKPVEN